MKMRTVDTLCNLVRAEYREMPGLCLTRQQFQRLWNLSPAACEQVVRHLLAEGFLRRTHDSRYRNRLTSSV